MHNLLRTTVQLWKPPAEVRYLRLLGLELELLNLRLDLALALQQPQLLLVLGSLKGGAPTTTRPQARPQQARSLESDGSLA